VSLLRRKNDETTEAQKTSEPEPSERGTKGRPTPKRRTQSGPVAPAPRTRKEALAWQKEQRKKQGTVAGQKKLTQAEYRELLKTGDPRVLPGRDQGPVRALARDWVDSRRMFSNYLLLLFPVMVVGYLIPAAQLGVLFCFFLIVIEWFFAARSIKRIAVSRGLEFREGTFSLAMYAGARAYFPRSWRRPLPRKEYGDDI
jgi:hypothetical protein